MRFAMYPDETAADMSTSLARERAEQRRWRLRAQWWGAEWFNALVTNEFLSADEQVARQARALSNLVEFAASQVPYYQQLFIRIRMTARDLRQPSDLTRLPPLVKLDVL